MPEIIDYKEILLRWTAAFKEKFEKQTKYLKNGIIKQNDAYIIAISGAQLRNLENAGTMYDVSSYPVLIQILFAVGVQQITLDRETGAICNSETLSRSNITNSNGANISTMPFMSDECNGISAVLGFSNNYSQTSSLPACIVHNPFAHSPIPRDILGQNIQEWYAERQKDDGYMNLIRHK